MNQVSKQFAHAPEFSTNVKHINTKQKITLKTLKGHVVLLDFWSYCCINSIHTVHDTKYLENKFGDSQFAVIKIHSAKFHEQNDINNIQAAIDRYEVEHPVLIDESMEIWNTYGVTVWPTFVLIDAEGYIRLFISGEGNKNIIESTIIKLLQEGESKGKLAKEPLQLMPDELEYDRLLSFPGKIDIDQEGKLLAISNTNFNQVVLSELKKYNQAKIKFKIGNSKSGFRDGSFEQAMFNHPQGVCIVDDLIYVCDSGNHVIREINLKEKSVKTIAGNVQQSTTGAPRGCRAVDAELNSPWDIAEHNGELYIAMTGAHQIWKYNIKSKTIEVYAGTGNKNLVDGFCLNAKLAQPYGLCIFKDKLYFVDGESSSLRCIDMKTNRLDTLIGKNLYSYGCQNGRFIEGLMQYPKGLCTDKNKIYIADSFNHLIRKVDLKKREISTIGGHCKKSNVCTTDNLNCDLLGLFEPNDVTIHKKNLYIADTNNHLIRVLNIDSGLLEEVRFK